MGGHVKGKVIEDSSVEVDVKLDIDNHTTDINNNKSIVNVEAMNNAIPSPVPINIDNVGYGKKVYKGLNTVNNTHEFKTLISSDDNITISPTQDSLNLNVNINNILSTLLIPDSIQLNNGELQLLSGTVVLSSVNLQQYICDTNCNDTKITPLDISSNSLCGLTFAPITTVYGQYLSSTIPDVIFNGMVLYTDFALTTPFNGGGNEYRFKGVVTSGNEVIFNVDSNGVVSNLTVCSYYPTIQKSFDYHSSDSTQGSATPNGSVYTILSSDILSLYTGSGTPDKITVTVFPTIGNLGDENSIINPINNTVPLVNINGGHVGFWCNGLIDLVGQANIYNGDFQTFFMYDLKDVNDVVLGTYKFILNANDLDT